MKHSDVHALAVGVAAVFGAVAALEAQRPVDSTVVRRTVQAAGTVGTARALDAYRLSGAAPVIDGWLDEEVWTLATPATDFVQREPNAGQPASQRTEIRIAYDDDAIYVGARMHDTEPARIVGQLARRDEDVHSDWILAGFDSYFDRRTAFVFALNPRGVKRDFMVFNDTESDDSWDAVWDGSARLDSLGWTAEFRIPFSQLRFAAAEKQVWGANFARQIARLGEESFWSPSPPEVDRIVSLFGELRELRGLRPPRRLEVQPYAVGRVTRAPDQAGNPFFRRTDPTGAVGADIKYGLTSNLTLAATLNPDFGQVEADPSQVNLTAYETFFSERRPFFIEGTDIFRFGLQPGGGAEAVFYSRRIGRLPQGGAPDGAEHTSEAEPAPILAALKLSGKTAGGWSIGALEAVTGERRIRYRLEDGASGERIVEPRANHLVLRAIRDFRDGGSAIGAIGTAVHRDLGPDTRDFLRDAAYAGGFDARHRFGPSGNLELRAWVLGSHVRGTSEAVALVQRSAGHNFDRPDADHLEYDPSRASLSGAAALVEVTKFGGGNWRWASFVSARSPGFEVNDLGFQRDADAITQAAFVGYQQSRAGRIFRNWQVNLNGWHSWTTGRERTGTGMNVNGHFQLNSLWGGYGGIARAFEALSPNALRGGPALVRPAGTNMWLGMFTDRRKAVRGELEVGHFRQDESGSRGLSVHTWIGIRPSDRADLSLGPGWMYNDDAAQWVRRVTAIDGGTHYLHGRLEQHTLSLTTRLGLTFTPELSFQLYAQPFVSAGRYDRFSTVVDPRAGHFDDRFRELAPSDITYDEVAKEYVVDLDGNDPDFRFARPDFTIREFASTSVLRWEYRPASTLYVVWSQGRSGFEPDGRFEAGRDARRIFGIHPTNVLLVKVSYWLSL